MDAARLMFTKKQIARAALEAGVEVEKIKEMLKYLGDSTVLRSDECADRNANVLEYSGYANNNERPAITELPKDFFVQHRFKWRYVAYGQ